MRAQGWAAELVETREPGHATALARDAALQGWSTVIAAGGDGTVHEVANGLVRAERPDVTLAVLPLGSANDYADTLGLEAGWWCHPGRGVEARPADVGVVRAPGGRESFFVNNLGIGLTGAVALDAEGVRLPGLGRYMVGLLRTLCFRYHAPPMTITLDGKTRHEPTLALSLGIGRREGNFLLVPNAQLDDGLFDYVHAGALTRLTLLRLLPRGITGRLPTDFPGLEFGRCRDGRVRSATPLIVHTDGEFFCRPEEHVCELEVALLPGRLRVLRRV
jgi:diacylglycerol kinase family enzyme